MRSAFPALAVILLLASTVRAADEAVPVPTSAPRATAQVIAKLPKYSQARPVETVDRRETDRPRNTIVRLPKELLPPEAVVASSGRSEDDGPAPDGVVRLPRYDVQQRRLPRFKEREIMTPQARVDRYLKRHPGLHIGNLFGLNRGIAAAMIADEDEHDRRMEMAELTSFQAFAEAQPRPNASRDSADVGQNP